MTLRSALPVSGFRADRDHRPSGVTPAWLISAGSACPAGGSPQFGRSMRTPPYWPASPRYRYSPATGPFPCAPGYWDGRTRGRPGAAPGSGQGLPRARRAGPGRDRDPSTKSAIRNGIGVTRQTRHTRREVMTTRKIHDPGRDDKAERTIRSRIRLRILLVLPVAAAAAVALAACGSSGTPSAASSPAGSSSPAAAAALSVKTAQIGNATVLTNTKGFTLYAFSPDTSTTSKCVGTCAQIWPPVLGPVTAAGVTGTFGTIKRADSTTQATFDGHPLYT